MYRIFYLGNGVIGVFIIIAIMIWWYNVFYRRACKRIKRSREGKSMLNENTEEIMELGKYHKDNINKEKNKERLRNRLGK